MSSIGTLTGVLVDFLQSVCYPVDWYVLVLALKSIKSVRTKLSSWAAWTCPGGGLHMLLADRWTAAVLLSGCHVEDRGSGT